MSDQPQEYVDPRVKRTRDNVLRSAAEILLEQGWDHVTHAHVAKRAGYSKATIYKHWATQSDLLHGALVRICNMPHGITTGDLRHDLISELEAFRQVLINHGFDKVLASLAERALSDSTITPLRDDTMTHGAQPTRDILNAAADASHIDEDTDHDVALSMYLGGLIYATVFRGQRVNRAFVKKSVDLLLHGLLPRDPHET